MICSLEKKNAVVCGSTSGIGRAIAIEFAKAGAEVTLVSRDIGKLIELCDELPRPVNQKHSFLEADFNEPEILKDKINKFISNYPEVHILVNNSGGPKSGAIYEAATGEFESAFRQHLVCYHILVQSLAEGMKKEKYGRIINIISTSVKQPIKNLGVSNTIRAAVASWAKTLSAELAPYGITVNNILPGATKTQRLYQLFKARAEASSRTEEEIANEWLSEIPCGRFAEPEEIAYAAVFLASPFASYINGINLTVDGGRSGCLL